MPEWKKLIQEAKETVDKAQDDRSMPDEAYKECNEILSKLDDLLTEY